MALKQYYPVNSADQLRILRAKRVTLASRMKAIDYNIAQLEKLEKLREVQRGKVSWWQRLARGIWTK